MINAIKLRPGKKVLLNRRGDAFDVAHYMKETVDQSIKSPRMQAFVKKNPMDTEGIFNFSYQCALFEPDKRNDQILKTPLAVIRTRKANCVNYSVLMATLMKLNDIPGSFRMISEKRGQKPRHIYVISDSGKVMDCVLGQDQKGEKSFDERENKKGFYNKEVKYFSKFDKPF